MRKERDTVILSVRIKADLLPLIDEAVERSRMPSRNSWLIWAIQQGRRSHRKKYEPMFDYRLQLMHYR